jgi:hypothetical protein
MTAQGHSRPMRSKPHVHVCPLLPRKRTNGPTSWDVRFVPCVDGSELARVFFTFAGWSVRPCVRPVSAAHRPLAIMPSADQVPVKSPVPTTNPKQLTATSSGLILAADERPCRLIWCALIGLFRRGLR